MQARVHPITHLAHDIFQFRRFRAFSNAPLPRCITRAHSIPQDEVSEPADWIISDDGAQRQWQRKDIHVVLVHPCIPQNTGNIARTCAATEVALHVVGPIGFSLDDKKLKRSGLDYWPAVAVKYHNSWGDFMTFFTQVSSPQKRLIAFSKFGKQHYAGFAYRKGDWLVFGAETTGLPQEAHHAAQETGGSVVKIPMQNYTYVRSLNLATSVGIGLFEALRQLDGTECLPEEKV